MQIKNFIGIDVSKDTLDLSVVVDGKHLSHCKIKNTAKEIKVTIVRMLQNLNGSYADTVFCMEHTGIYNLPMVKWLHSNGANIWIESGIHIRRTLGLVRGKNDKVDSARIAMFAFTNRHQIRLWKPPRKVIERLSVLISQRSRLIKAKKQLQTANREQKKFIDKDIMKSLNNYTNRTVVVIEKQIIDIEKEIKEVIRSDEKLHRLYKIMISVSGVGFVTACNVLITTNEFININDPKKYACYCGVAPFEHSSGTSIKGKNRVSHFANKSIKTLFHLASMSAIGTPGDIREYYLRKIEEGKNKMSVLNAIRNKIIHRIFACVKENRIYEKNYSYSLA